MPGPHLANETALLTGLLKQTIDLRPLSGCVDVSYLINHWRGKLPLSISFWVNMIGLLILLTLVEYFIFARLTIYPNSLIRNTLISLFITRLIIYPWQLIGLFRAIERDFIEHKNSLKTRGLQVVALLTLLFTLIYCLEVFQGASFYLHQLKQYTPSSDRAGYQLAIDAHGQQLKIEGSLDIGINKEVKSMLKRHPQIKSVSLQSDGGQIYEGRGLAKLFTQLGLNTYVYGTCSSACTIAFVGGKERYLGANGKLGFHQYKLDTSEHQKIVPFYDTKAEQQRDLALFQSLGIKQDFLRQIFNQPASGIWFPDHKALLDAQVVHTVLTE